MANNIDNRIVKMEMDNSKFTAAANSTMVTLSNLSKKLQLTEGVKGLGNVTSAAKNVSFNAMEKGVDNLTTKFSAMGIAGVTALVNITNRAVDAGIKFAKSLTVDPVMDGLKEYETKMNAIQTIMTNTKSKGTTLDDINAALAELNTYSDQTIYNFAQMTDNIGKATAAGLGLGDSVTFVKGMANVAAGFGVDAQKMAGATYQMTQALSAGVVRAQDWMSMDTAGMGGEMFRDELLKSAKSMGVFVDLSEGFKGSLKENWLSTDIFMDALGKMANNQDLIDAATKVKTFTQLIDVMKEAVGSGWAMSWEHIIGNKEESTELFTSISNGFGNIVGKMADYRNEGLENWKALGGRDDLLRGLERIFYGISNVIGPIYEAFKKIFDPWNGRALANLSKEFKNLMTKMAVTKETGAKIGKTFEALFSVVKLGLSLFKPLLSFITGMLGTGGNLIDMIASVTSGIADWVLMATDWIETSGYMTKAMDFMSEAGASVGEVLRKAFGNASEYIDTAMSTAYEWAPVVGKSLKTMGGEAKKYLGMAADAAVEFNDKYKPLENGLEYLKMGFTALVSKIKEFYNFLKDAGNNIQDLFQSITDRMKASDITGTDMLNFGIFGVLVVGVKKIFTFLRELTKGSKGFIDGVTEALGAVKDSLEAYQKSLKADMIMKIAISIGILAASIFVLSKVQPDRLLPAVAALLAVGAGLTGMLKLLDGFDGMKFKNAAAMLVAGIGFAIAASILASALKKLSDLNWPELAKGIVGLTAVVGLMGGLIFGLSKLDLDVEVMANMTKLGISLVALGLAVYKIAQAFQLFAKLSWPDLLKGMSSLVVILGSMSVFGLAVKNAGKDIASAASGISMIAASMIILAGGISLLALLKLDDVIYAFKIMGVVLSAVAVFGLLVKGCGKDVAMAAIGMNLMAWSFIALSGAILLYSKIDWTTFLNGLARLGLLMATIGLTLKLFPKNLVLQASGFIALAAAMAILTVCLVALAKVPIEGIKAGLIGLAGMMIILGVSAALIAPLSTGLFILAGALAVVGIAIAAIGGGLFLFSLSLGSVAASGVAAAAALATGLMALSAVFPVVAAALALSIVSFITVLSYNAPALQKAFTALIMAGYNTIITTAPLWGQALVAMVTSIITSICTVIINNAPIMAQALVTMVNSALIALTGCLDALRTFVTEAILMIIDTILTIMAERTTIIVAHIAQFLVDILTTLAEYIPQLVTAGFDLIIAFWTSMLENIAKMVDSVASAIIDFINNLATVITNRAPELRAAAWNLVKAIIGAFIGIGTDAFKIAKDFGGKLVSGIRGMVSSVVGAAKNLATGVINGIKSLPGQALEVGKNIISGIKNGISNGIASVKSAALNVAKSALSSAKSFLGIHSPSRAFAEVGKYSDEGFVEGLLKGAKGVADAGVNVADGALTGMKDAMSQAGSVFDVDTTISPVIKPVVDLSEVQNGARQVGSMMPKDYNLDMKANVKTAGRLSDATSKTSVDGQGSTNTTNNTTNENINHFHISGAEDPNAIADKVSKILDNQVKRRGAVWA